MRRPDQWPNVPYAAFIDAVGPSVNSDFLNTLQEGMTDLIGALWGRSATLLADEFEELTYPVVGKRGRFDEITVVNAQSVNAPPLSFGDHGLLRMAALAAAPALYTLEDALSWIDTFDFAFSGKALVTTRAALNTAGAEGFLIGIRNPPAALGLEANFRAGSDLANWQVVLRSTMIDTGVPVVDGRFYRFQIARKAGTAYAFIDGMLVATLAFPDILPGVIRQIKTIIPGAAPLDGFYVDYHRVWIQR